MRKTFIILPSFAAFFLLLICLLIYPLLQGIKDDAADLLSVKENLLSFEARSRRVSALKEEYEELGAQFDRINNLLVDSEAPIGFIGFLENLAEESDVSIEISAGASKKEKNALWTSLNFQVGVIGAFSNCLKFIERLETAPYLIKLQNLTSRRLTEKDIQAKNLEGFSVGDISADLSLQVFGR